MRKSTEHELYSGQRLKKFRRKLNYTRDDVEFETGGQVSVRTLARWERHGIPENVQIKKLLAVCKALQLPNLLEDIEKVETAYLQSLTLDVVQERLETAADDMRANEIVKIIEFVNNREESEPDSDTLSENPMHEIVKD